MGKKTKGRRITVWRHTVFFQAGGEEVLAGKIFPERQQLKWALKGDERFLRWRSGKDSRKVMLDSKAAQQSPACSESSSEVHGGHNKSWVTVVRIEAGEWGGGQGVEDLLSPAKECGTYPWALGQETAKG